MIVGIYSRKSKFTGKGESIGNQLLMCKEYVSTYLKDKKVTEFIEYEDEGYGGGDINRPAFKRLMEDVRSKKIDILICYRLDRISRNVADFSTTLGILQANNVDFISIREQFDTSSPMGRAMIYIASVFAQLERETIAERVRDNMLELAKTGRWLGGVAPIGYESTPITYMDESMTERKMSKLTQVPSELEIVKLIYAKYLELKSLSKVETFLIQNNIKPKRGSYFGKPNLRIILSNTVYVKANEKVLEHLESKGITVCGNVDGVSGLLSYNKQKTVKNKNGNPVKAYRDQSDWIAAVSSQKGIIEAEDWIMVQNILSENRDKFPNEGKTHNALLTGILKCSKCGSNMQIAHGRVSVKTGKKIYYYTCSLKKLSKGTKCDNKNVNVDELDFVIKKCLKNLNLDKMIILTDMQNKNKKVKEINAALNKEESIKKSIEEKKKQIDNLMTKVSIDPDIADIFIEKIKNIKKEITQLNLELNNINSDNNKTDDTEIELSFMELLLEKCSLVDSLSHEEVKQLADALFESITWNGETNEFTADFIGSKDSKKK